MEIRKTNNNFKNIMQQIKDNIDKKKLMEIYNQLDRIPVKFKPYDGFFNISKSSRVIKQLNCLHHNNKDKYKDHDDFALYIEYNWIDGSIDNKMSKYYEKDWTDALEIYDTNFLSYAILQFFENQCEQFIKLKSNDGKFIINIFYSSQITSEKELTKIIYQIYNILNWIIEVGDARFVKLRLDIILCPFKKTFKYNFSSEELQKYPWLSWTNKMNNDGIRPFNINTGVSYISTNHIILYRTDELFKVLIHECIHSFKYDFNSKDCGGSSCEKILITDVKLNIGNTRGLNNYPILVNEGFTEYMAILCWNYYLASYFMFTNNEVITNKFELFNNMINKELVNSAIMCQKLFKYYDITDLTILNNNNFIKQYTNAFSYILIKYILLINMVGIIENKNVYDINVLLKKEFDNMSHYNYLVKLPVDENDLLQLSLFHFKLSN